MGTEEILVREFRTHTSTGYNEMYKKKLSRATLVYYCKPFNDSGSTETYYSVPRGKGFRATFAPV